MLTRHADSTCCLFIINNHGRTSSNIGVYVSSTSPILATLTTTLVTQDVHTTLVTLDVHTLDIDLISPHYITDARSFTPIRLHRSRCLTKSTPPPNILPTLEPTITLPLPPSPQPSQPSASNSHLSGLRTP